MPLDPQDRARPRHCCFDNPVTCVPGRVRLVPRPFLARSMGLVRGGRGCWERLTFRAEEAQVIQGELSGIGRDKEEDRQEPP